MGDKLSGFGVGCFRRTLRSSLALTAPPAVRAVFFRSLITLLQHLDHHLGSGSFRSGGAPIMWASPGHPASVTPQQNGST